MPMNWFASGFALATAIIAVGCGFPVPTAAGVIVFLANLVLALRDRKVRSSDVSQ